MKRLTTLFILSIITVISFAQNNYAVYNNTVYEVSYNDNGNRVLTELGKVESITNTNKKWKLSGNITTGMSAELNDSPVQVTSICGMASIGGRYNKTLYIGAGTGIVNNTIKYNSNKSHYDSNYCAIPVFAEISANTNSSKKVDFYGNLKVGTDIITSDRYTYDGNAIFTTRVSVGIMICKHITAGVTYSFQAKSEETGHSLGGSISFVF